MVGNNFPSTIKFYAGGLSQMTGQFAFVEPINIADTQEGLNAFCGTLTLIFMVLYLLDLSLIHIYTARSMASQWNCWIKWWNCWAVRR